MAVAVMAYESQDGLLCVKRLVDNVKSNNVP